MASSENVENLILQTYFKTHKSCNYLILADTNSFCILLPALLAEFRNYATYLDFGGNGFTVQPPRASAGIQFVVGQYRSFSYYNFLTEITLRCEFKRNELRVHVYCLMSPVPLWQTAKLMPFTYYWQLNFAVNTIWWMGQKLMVWYSLSISFLMCYSKNM